MIHISLPLSLTRQAIFYGPATPSDHPGKVANRAIFDDDPTLLWAFIRKAVEGELEPSLEQLGLALPEIPETVALLSHWRKRPDLWVMVSGNMAHSCVTPIYRGAFPFETRQFENYTLALTHTNDDAFSLGFDLQQSHLNEQANVVGKYVERLDTLAAAVMSRMHLPLAGSTPATVN
jgi:hypothetical protein